MTGASPCPRLHRPHVVHGAHRATADEFFALVERHFASHLRDYEVDARRALEQARHIACTSSGIEQRHLVRPLADLMTPLSPQQQADMYRTVGLE